jgi:hypothetical protein
LTTLAVEALLDGEAETITRKAIELAKEGDLTALRLCLDRIAPPRKDRPEFKRARRTIRAIRPHASLGYKPPAPEVFVPAFAAWQAALRRAAPPATLAKRPTLN